jgi:hypothetical protein
LIGTREAEKGVFAGQTREGRLGGV